ncbi:hypothetical protein QFZ28_005976 [Neobacillus niacini]|uniref:hypothetical protein n=1 Tax=Neobacillus niacini TaxID=86668 RepID=UPI00278B14C2|nr:hypothetical protein [Neobacillus niacini]MDQ1005398.1 hypothetical protein [Neobacillus niacini]
MNSENKQVISVFFHKDRFKLNSYLTYLFNEFKNFKNHLEDGDNKQCNKTYKGRVWENDKYGKV